MNYRVQLNDTPASIARKFNGDPRHLILVNPHKPKIVINGDQTFRNLAAGEVIALPPSWRVGLHGVGVGHGGGGHGGGGHGGGHGGHGGYGGHGWGGHGGWGGGGGYWDGGVWVVDDGWVGLAGFGLGAPNAANVTADAAAVMALDGATPGLNVPSITVLTFQQDYNAAVAAGTYAGPALAQLDGEYGPNASTALAQVQGSVAVVPTGFTSFSAETAANLTSWLAAIGTDPNLNAPSSNVLAFQDNWNHLINVGTPPVSGASILSQDGEYGNLTAAAAASFATANGLAAPPAASPTYATGGGSPAPTPAPGPAPAPITLPVTVITGTAPSSMTPILIAAVVAAGGLGAFYYLKHRKHGATSSAPSSRSAATVRSPMHRRFA